jgi:acyl-ACP thioesterase
MQQPVTPLAYSCSYTVKTYDIDTQRRMKVASLVMLMQEAAMQNVIEMKLSAWDLEPLKISWVLLRKNLRINRLPMVEEKLRVETYPAGFEKFFTYRDYKVFDEKEELIAHSATTWLLLHTVERRMVRIPEFILAFEPQMPAGELCLPRPKAKLPVFEKSSHDDIPFRVNWHDLDFNGHLNNVYYLQWMLETLPEDRLASDSLREMEILYKTEAHWKDRLTSGIQQVDERTYLHSLVRVSDGKELAAGMSHFE